MIYDQLSLNSPLDWISLGLTRRLLINIREGHQKLTAVGWALLDVIFAAVFWLLMLGTVASVLTFIDVYWVWNSEKAINIADFLRKFGENPWKIDYLWIHIMAATTLLPTIAHFIIASFALVYLLSPILAYPFVRERIENWPEQQEVDGDRLVVATSLFMLDMCIVLIISPIFIVICTVLLQGPVELYIQNISELLLRSLSS